MFSAKGLAASDGHFTYVLGQFGVENEVAQESVRAEVAEASPRHPDGVANGVFALFLCKL